MGYVGEIAKLFPPQGEWTEEDYFSLPDTNRLIELSEGKLVMPPHPTPVHQEIVQRLFLKLHAFAEKRDAGRVYLAPLPVRLWPGNIREPDLFFVAKEHRERIKERFCEVPDLVVEVTSPGTRRADRGEKRKEYALAGVREYWLVDPDRKTIEIYTLKEKGFELAGRYGTGSVASSELLPGLEVAVDEVLP